jgi:hypothetical protein
VKRNHLVAFDFPPAACVAAITCSISSYLTSPADQVSTGGRPGFEGGFRHDMLMFALEVVKHAHNVDSVGVDSFVSAGRSQRFPSHNAVYTSVDFSLFS